MRALLMVGLVVLGTEVAGAAPVTVFLDRDGMEVPTDDGTVTIPRFGGTQRTWNAMVGCVRDKFSPFAVDIVEQRPASGQHITALIGGRAEQLGYDGAHVAGIGASGLDVIPDAVVYVFAKTIGESDTRELCSTAAHEIGHALGLDHSMQCGDLMSYPRDECGDRELRFIDADAACGEYQDRTCDTGEATQNSFRRLAALVGLRREQTASPDPISPPEDSSSEYSDSPEQDNSPDYSIPFEQPPESEQSSPPECSQAFRPDEVAPPPQAQPRHRHRHRGHRRGWMLRYQREWR